ncbi:elongation factor P [Candidatus Nomurabacteria bacterium]|uniref:Elongation factor P n=1 Tax=candidate division WWE3 bacterium TaxID=2053526 RepID=A0A955E0C9_UNCKA|nr:elongation factor P [candidate division WWE3 bacterium]MCB9823687.1 elongation factor P [Candidatus Nomurabacteria bacterium]MCB9827235.1 elongation factor P [Candidatus Nomurabacteria bacterium]MCB9827482.1 elongation factor P [Candidatus Nomurabacteria bacterium]HXK52512.1 elongation factor P [bacterium]
MIATELKTGTIFKENEVPYLVLKYTHTKVARSGANVKVKAKSLLNGSVIEKSYNGTTKLEEADIFRKSAQYLYKEGGYIFMDPDTFEQFTIPEDILGESAQFLREGESVQVLYFEDAPISVELPISMLFEVTYTEPGFKGNTVSNVYKDATVDNGAVVKVPSFINIGEKVKIDTRTGEYISRA